MAVPSAEPLTPPDAPPVPLGEPARPPPVPRPGASTFTIEGRTVPALFVLGWLGSVFGLGLIAIAFLSGGGIGGQRCWSSSALSSCQSD